MIRVQRVSDGAFGNAWQRTAATTIREIVIDNLIPVGCSIGDYVIALDSGDWDAAAAVDFSTLYTVVP